MKGNTECGPKKMPEKRNPYRLADVERRASLHKGDFEIPSREEREDLWPGDLVKLIFEGIGERLWIVVISVLEPHIYVGVIDSSPAYGDVYQGDEVIFSPENVADITRTTGSLVNSLIPKIRDPGKSHFGRRKSPLQ
jgi:hypothetical protein